MSEPEAYATLHDAIVSGELSPAERLVEEELVAERLGFSRGAVRAALSRSPPATPPCAARSRRRASCRSAAEKAMREHLTNVATVLGDVAPRASRSDALERPEA